MKIQLVILLSLLFALPIASPAQSTPSFTSGMGGFGIKLPPGNVVVEDTPEDEAGLGRGKRYTWPKIDNRVFVVTYYVASDKPMPLTYKNAVSAGIISGFTEGSERRGYTVEQKPYAFNGNKGVEFRLTMPGITSITRFFVTPTRIYLLQVSMRSGDVEAERTGVKALDTIWLLSRPELIAAKLKEAEPPKLPQSPAVARVSNDVLDAGLKGKVRSVTEETSPATGSPKEMLSIAHFDDRGNLTRKIEYSDKVPWKVSVYGFVDKMRVSNSEEIMFDVDQQNSLFGRIVSIIEAAAPGSSPEKPRVDLRFTERYEYKYDPENRLLSETVYSNTGRFQWQTSTEYTGNTRKTTTRAYDRSITEIKIEKLDNRGNVVEETEIDTETGKAGSPINYTYSFDTVGNWIVRRATQKGKVRGRIVNKNLETHYRTILYHQ